MNTLLIDVGNTRAHSALAECGTLGARADWPADRPDLVLARLRPALNSAAPAGIWVASVRPSADAPLAETLRAAGWPAPRFLGRDLPVPIPNRTREPEAVGVDRLCLALGSRRRVPDGASIACGIGTAITINVVSPDGAFLGGAIAPGLPASVRALHLVAEKLPEVPLAAPASVLGRTTLEALQAGIVLGAAGALEALLSRTLNELGSPARIFASGGDAALLAPFVPRIDEVVPDLLFEGMLSALEASGR